MTHRQKEFVRHYLAGKPAREAAMAAGYAHSTAERNAAEMLSHPGIAARITRLRSQTVFTRKDLAMLKTELDHIIRYVQDDRLKLVAMEKYTRLSRLELILPYLEPDENPEQIRIKNDENPAQSPDHQQDHRAEETDTPAEHDTLPDGTPAFDLKLSPQKPQPKKPDPVQIILVDKLTPPLTA